MTKELNKEKGLILAYQEVFGTPKGKKVLKDLMRIGRILQPSYVIQDPHATAHNEGMRRAILYILDKINMDAEAVAQLINQYNSGDYDE